MTATDLFVSYKAEDRARVKPLVDALEAEGFSVWWDVHIEGGANWHEDIAEHLDAAKCVVVAWSRRSISANGQFVRDEARRAQKRGVYVPVRLDRVEPPLGLGEIQAVPLIGWKGQRDDPRFIALCKIVRSHIAGERIAHSPIYRDRPAASRRSVVVGAVALAGAASAASWFFLRSNPEDAKRIAVMPFANLSGASDQTYFAEGIAEERNEREGRSHRNGATGDRYLGDEQDPVESRPDGGVDDGPRRDLPEVAAPIHGQGGHDLIFPPEH